MERITLQKDTLECSRMAYGLWRLAEDPEDHGLERVRRKIDTCLENGITTFDHADIYGGYTCEGIFGEALKADPGLRGKIELITKCSIKVESPALPDVRVKHYDTSATAIVESVERSLRELRTDHIDLLLIHRPDWLTSAESTADGLRQVVRSGKVRAVGVSNYATAQFELLQSYLDIPLATNQVEVNPLEVSALEDGRLDQCQRLGRHPMVWSPLAGGRLFDDAPAARRMRACAENLRAKYNGATLDQLVYAWALALPSEPLVIIGSNQPERIRKAAESAEIRLQREDWYAIWEAGQGREIP